MVTVMSSPVAEKTGRMIRMPNGTGRARIMGDRCGNHCLLVPLNGGGVGLGLWPYGLLWRGVTSPRMGFRPGQGRRLQRSYNFREQN